MSPLPFNKRIEFPLEGEWIEVHPDKVAAAMDAGNRFVIEGFLEADEDYPAETGWAYRALENDEIVYLESDSIFLEDLLSATVDATQATEVDGITVYLAEGGPGFRFFLPAE